MLDVRMIASDMDGTLLNAEGKISPRTLEAIRRAQQKGIVFSICTGRFPEHCRAFADEAGLDCSIISNNGCTVWDASSQKVICDHVMSAEAAQQVWEIVQRYPVKCRITKPGGMADNYAQTGASASYFAHICQVMQRDYGVTYAYGKEALDRFVRDPVYKSYIYAFPNEEMRMQAAEELSKVPGIYVTSSGPKNLETMPVGIDKGTGIAELAAFYGIPLENVMVFGDYDNDLPMFQCVGYPVAMGNAVEQLKLAAWHVAAPNTEDGLAQVIERYILEE